jgi:CBS domain-containing protein
MRIQDILRTKGTQVMTVGPDQTVLAAIRVLSEHRIGSLVVRRGDDILGIITERDVLNLVAREPHRLAETLVEEAMTTDLVVGVPEDDLDYVMGIMTENRIRHLPIIVDGQLHGLVSIGDVVNAVRRSVESENRYLKDYIHGVAG